MHYSTDSASWAFNWRADWTAECILRMTVVYEVAEVPEYTRCQPPAGGWHSTRNVCRRLLLRRVSLDVPRVTEVVPTSNTSPKLLTTMSTSMVVWHRRPGFRTLNSPHSAPLYIRGFNSMDVLLTIETLAIRGIEQYRAWDYSPCSSTCPSASLTNRCGIFTG